MENYIIFKNKIRNKFDDPFIMGMIFKKRKTLIHIWYKNQQ